MAKASLLPQALTPTYKNLTSIAQETITGEMSKVTKKVTTPQPDAAPLGDSSYVKHIV